MRLSLVFTPLLEESGIAAIIRSGPPEGQDQPVQRGKQATAYQPHDTGVSAGPPAGGRCVSVFV